MTLTPSQAAALKRIDRMDLLRRVIFKANPVALIQLRIKKYVRITRAFGAYDRVISVTPLGLAALREWEEAKK